VPLRANSLGLLLIFVMILITNTVIYLPLE